MEIKEIHRKKSVNVDKTKAEDLLKKMRKEHEKLCKGLFEFIDAQGGWLDFTYRWFPEDPIRTIRLTHGEICELPMGIVKHLNNTKKKIRKFGANMGAELKEGRGIPQAYEVQSRVRFTPVDVM